MDFDLDHLDIEKAEKTAKALEYFGLFALGVLAFLATRIRAYNARRPRVRIKALEKDVEALRTLLGELTKSVAANGTNIISVTDQLSAIVGDADRKISMVRTDQDARFVRVGLFDDLCERVSKLDDRIWDGVDRRGDRQVPAPGTQHRQRGGVRREARNDTGD